MLVLHIYIMGRHGNIERTYDFLRSNGKEELEGCDLIIPYEDELHYPISEMDAVGYVNTRDKEGDH